MSSIEERLARDIEAVTGGVVVTESDLEQARAQVEERIEPGRYSRRRTAVALLAAAAVAAGVVGVMLIGDPGGEADSAPADSAPSDDVGTSFLVGETPTKEDLQGVWRVDNGMTLVRFSSDNEVAFDTRGQILTPELSGTYSLDGDQITLDVTSTEDADCGGQTILRAAVAPTGLLRVIHTQPLEGVCAPEQSGRWTLEHLLPTDEPYTRFGPPRNGDYGPLRATVPPGFWLVVGGGYGLQLTADGSYSVLGNSGQVIEGGRWELEGDELSLTGDARGCRVGISGVQRLNAGTDWIRGELTEYRCETAWVTGDSGDTMAWVLIPDRSSS